MTQAALLKRLGLAVAIPRYYLIAAFGYGFHPLGGARSMLSALQERYWPVEAWQVGLLRPGADARADTRFMSKARMVAIQRRINPVSWEHVLSDKGVFARWTLAAGLPCPALLAWAFSNGSGATPAGRHFTTIGEWERFLTVETPPEFVVKSSRSSYGRSVHVIRREGECLFGFDGREIQPRELVGLLRRGGPLDSHVIQERVENHPDLIALSGSRTLQTVRIVTVAGFNGTVSLVNAFFKPVVGRNEVDNFRSGRTGNLLANAALDTGVLGPGVTIRPGGGILTLERHPETGYRIEGFRLPGWEEAVALTRRAAELFLPVRMIGFDVALTPGGPKLIEANFWPDPPTLTCPLDQVTGRLRAALGGRL